MLKKTMDLLCEAANQEGIEVHKREEYHVRQISTCAIVVDNIGELFACAFIAGNNHNDEEEMDEIIEDLKGSTWDNMGKRLVIY